MNKRKIWVRFFTIADYEEEELWLHNQHKTGWRLLKMVPPCFYIFEECAPQEVAYRLDYRNNAEPDSYFQMFEDYGWEYLGQCVGWLYFRKPVSQGDFEQDGELFSDRESKVEMIDHVIKTRLLPLLAVFVGCILPGFVRTMETEDPLAAVFTALLAAVALLYLGLIISCGLKLRKLRRKYTND